MNYIKQAAKILSADQESLPYDIINLYYQYKRESKKGPVFNDNGLPLFNINDYGMSKFPFVNKEELIEYFCFEPFFLGAPILKKDTDDEIILLFDHVLLRDVDSNPLSFIIKLRENEIVIKNINKEYFLDFYMNEIQLIFPFLFIADTKEVKDLVSDLLYPLIVFRDRYSCIDIETFKNDIVALYNNGYDDFGFAFDTISNASGDQTIEPLLHKLKLI